MAEFDVASLNALRKSYYTKNVQETTGTASSANTWVTLVSITGVGWLYMLRGSFSASALSPQYRITVDGGTPITTGDPLTTVLTRWSGTFALPVAGVRFNSSLRVEFLQTDINGGAGQSGTGNVIWGSA